MLGFGATKQLQIERRLLCVIVGQSLTPFGRLLLVQGVEILGVTAAQVAEVLSCRGEWRSPWCPDCARRLIACAAWMIGALWATASRPYVDGRTCMPCLTGSGSIITADPTPLSKTNRQSPLL